MESAIGSLDASRVLFGFSVQFHYLFVPLTIGLAALIALLDGLAWRNGDEALERVSAFLGRFFLLNFVCGVLTGWPLRYHIRDQWSGFADMAGEVLDHVFMIEGRLAPLLFGLVIAFACRAHMPAGVRALVSALLAGVLVAQSLAIVALNAWMQLPSGGWMVNGRFHLDDAWALFTNPLWASKVLHTLSAAYVVGGVFVMAISAWLLLRCRHERMAQVSLRLSAGFTLIALVVTALAGHRSGQLLRQYQPAKFAAIEGIWRPLKPPAALTLLAWPDAASRTNRYAIEVPGMLDWITGARDAPPILSLQEIEQDMQRSLHAAWLREVREGAVHGPVTLAQHQRDTGLLGLLTPRARDHAAPNEADTAVAVGRAVPPVAPVFLGFRAMVAVCVLLVLLTTWVTLRMPDSRRRSGRRTLWLCVLALPLPWVATIAGWMVCEIGRQPWVVSGVLTTGESLGRASAAATALGILGWGMVYAVMLFTNLLVSVHWIRMGPTPRHCPVPELHAYVRAGRRASR